MSYFSVARLDEDARREQHTNEVIAALRKVLATVTDAETAQRGYLITGQESYLEPYENAVQTIEANLQALRQLTAEHGGPQAQAEGLGAARRRAHGPFEEQHRTTARRRLGRSSGGGEQR
jgi:CHASE3 domain sensor protein